MQTPQILFLLGPTVCQEDYVTTPRPDGVGRLWHAQRALVVNGAREGWKRLLWLPTWGATRFL